MQTRRPIVAGICILFSFKTLCKELNLVWLQYMLVVFDTHFWKYCEGVLHVCCWEFSIVSRIWPVCLDWCELFKLIIFIYPFHCWTGGRGLHPGQVQSDGAQWASSTLSAGPGHDPWPWTRSVVTCLSIVTLLMLESLFKVDTDTDQSFLITLRCFVFISTCSHLICMVNRNDKHIFTQTDEPAFYLSSLWSTVEPFCFQTISWCLLCRLDENWRVTIPELFPCEGYLCWLWFL